MSKINYYKKAIGKMTFKEWSETLQKNINCLRGRKVNEIKGGIGTLYKEVLGEIVKHPFSYNFGAIEIETQHFNKVELIHARPTYHKDKRRSSGYGNKIESVELCRSRHIPNDIELENLTQYIEYEYAKERKTEIMSGIKELENEIKERINVVTKLDEIMRGNKYSSTKV